MKAFLELDGVICGAVELEPETCQGKTAFIGRQWINSSADFKKAVCLIGTDESLDIEIELLEDKTGNGDLIYKNNASEGGRYYWVNLKPVIHEGEIVNHGFTAGYFQSEEQTPTTYELPRNWKRTRTDSTAEQDTPEDKTIKSKYLRELHKQVEKANSKGKQAF